MTMFDALPTTSAGHALGALFGRTVGRVGLVARAANLLLLWHERATQRAMLARMDDRDLADIGLSRGDIAAEIGKSFWRA